VSVGGSTIFDEWARKQNLLSRVLVLLLRFYPPRPTLVVSSNPKQDRHYPLSSSPPLVIIFRSPSPLPPPRPSSHLRRSDGLLPFPSIRSRPPNPCSRCLLGTFLLQSPSRRSLCADGFYNLVQFRYLLPEFAISPRPSACSRVPGCSSWVIFFAIRTV
jgi:hypothetical protein